MENRNGKFKSKDGGRKARRYKCKGAGVLRGVRLPRQTGGDPLFSSCVLSYR
jgi:hypothetical protein